MVNILSPDKLDIEYKRKILQNADFRFLIEQKIDFVDTRYLKMNIF